MDTHGQTSEVLQAILAQLTALQESNAALHQNNIALQESLAKQEDRHHQAMEEIRSRISTVEQSASKPRLTVTNAEGETVIANTTKSGTGSPPMNPTPPTTRTYPSEPVMRSEKLPDPPPFNGKKKDLPLFLTKLRYKLKGNSDRYPDEESRLIYAHSCLGNDPATLISPLMFKDINTIEDFIGFLESTYGDPNRELTAWSRLDNLTQGKKNFLAHFADFRRLVADTDLNESAQINQLRRSLSEELRRVMVGVAIPRSLNDYANIIAQYDNDLRYLPTTRAQAPRKTLQRYPTNMEIDNMSYAPKNSTERQKRISEGRCFKCNKKGHISRDCSASLPHQQIRANSATRSELSSNSSRASSPKSPRPRGRSAWKGSPGRKGKASSRG